jgi:hypothetical protein
MLGGGPAPARHAGGEPSGDRLNDVTGCDVQTFALSDHPTARECFAWSTLRVRAEDYRVEAETQRTEAENTRDLYEIQREAAELAREAAESLRRAAADGITRTPAPSSILLCRCRLPAN